MATCKLFLCAILFLSSFAFMAHSQVYAKDILKCLEKLLPCRIYIHSPKPSPVCCKLLKGYTEGDPKCPCAIISNEPLLKSFNTTREEAHSFPTKCGYKVPDIKLCSKFIANVTTSPHKSPNSVSTAGNRSTSIGSKSAASAIIVMDWMVSTAILLCSSYLFSLI